MELCKKWRCLVAVLMLSTGVKALIIPRAALADYTPTYTSVGCYSDATTRTLTGTEIEDASGNTIESCATSCGSIGFSHAGTEYGRECYCGDQIENGATKLADSSCNYACPGAKSEICGGNYTISLYKISNPRLPSNKVALDCDDSPLKGSKVCDTSLTYQQRAAALVALMTVDEKANQLINSASGVSRLNLASYQWWNEALHGLARGASYASSGDFSSSSSFPQIINLGASFDDPLVSNVAKVIGQEGRAFANNNRDGFDYWTPNVNPFRDPRWGRGQEVPGEDAYHIQSYVRQLVPGLQQHTVGSNQAQAIATCKHYAVYDVEGGRKSNNLDPTQQDLAEYYLAPFTACVRDAGAISVMCAYNAVDGYPSCANQYLLGDLLRGSYLNFTYPYNYVVSDCDAVSDVTANHKFTSDAVSAAAVSLNAGTDLNCGSTYQQLTSAVSKGYTSNSTLDKALTRMYTALFTTGALDGDSPYNSLGWADVNTDNAQKYTRQAGMEGLVLLKNDGTLPLKGSYKTIAVIGPMAQATTQLQGNYYGTAPYLTSPLDAFKQNYNVVYAQGTAVNSADTSNFTAALNAAKSADVVIYVGGIDNTIEAESRDRSSITWPGNQLDLISQLSKVGKPLVVVQWGAGQVDDSSLLSNAGVNSIVWAGSPGQDGGRALRDVLTGVWSIAGRLPVTQYPSAYTSQVTPLNPALRPSGSYPGRTYKWYTGKPVLPFGYGLHYTNFTFSWGTTPAASYSIQSLVSSAPKTQPTDRAPFTTVTANVKNTGGPANMSSDYVGLLFLSTKDAGPTPYPNKWLVSYTRAHNIAVSASASLTLPITLDSLARTDSNGDLTLYPGTYTLTLDNQPALTTTFTLTGTATKIRTLPAPSSTYSYSVPVTTQAATT